MADTGIEDALFDLDPAAVRAPEPVEEISADRRRTIRQAAALARGVHPLASPLGWPLSLHTEAAPADDRKAPGRRCGNCRFRQQDLWHDQTFAKCLHGETKTTTPRLSHSAATDIRAWWPACRDHEPGAPKLPDAMRWVPDGKEMR